MKSTKDNKTSNVTNNVSQAAGVVNNNYFTTNNYYRSSSGSWSHLIPRQNKHPKWNGKPLQVHTKWTRPTHRKTHRIALKWQVTSHLMVFPWAATKTNRLTMNHPDGNLKHHRHVKITAQAKHILL